MVHGIEVFRNYFGRHLNRYVIIGGTACNMVYAEHGAPQRATQDIDMVIVAEVFDREFYELFCKFVSDGSYEHRSKTDGYQLYRFEKPRDPSFPMKIELLSRRPEHLEGIESTLGRFGTIDAAGSLSAILLDDEYYALLDEGGIEVIDGLPILARRLLPVFKIHAWTNLVREKDAGKPVHSDEINKHRRDVLRLCALFDSDEHFVLPDKITTEISSFVDAHPWDDNMMRNLGLTMSADEMTEHIKRIFLVR